MTAKFFKLSPMKLKMSRNCRSPILTLNNCLLDFESILTFAFDLSSSFKMTRDIKTPIKGQGNKVTSRICIAGYSAIKRPKLKFVLALSEKTGFILPSMGYVTTVPSLRRQTSERLVMD